MDYIYIYYILFLFVYIYYRYFRYSMDYFFRSLGTLWTLY